MRPRRCTRAGSLRLGNVHGSRLALRATTCATCGSVKVFVGTTMVKKVSLVSTKKRRTALISITLPTAMAGTVKIRTLSGKTVIVDGLGVGQF